MALPNFQSQLTEFNMMQSQWASQLNPVIANSLVQGVLLERVSLSSGLNTINHRLGRKLKGWFVTRIRGPASLYDTQDTNQMPDKTLTLNSSAAVIVDLWVF